MAPHVETPDTHGWEAPHMNPFAERPPFKKRIITASLTWEQHKAFQSLKARTRTVTDAAMIKKALEFYIDQLDSEQGEEESDGA